MHYKNQTDENKFEEGKYTAKARLSASGHNGSSNFSHKIILPPV